LPLVNKEVKAGRSEEAIFKLFSTGLKTKKDEWVYDVSKNNLVAKMKFFIEIYQKTLSREKLVDIKNQIKWDRELENYLEKKITKQFNSHQIIEAWYRPFSKQYLYFDKHLNSMVLQWFNIYKTGQLNKCISFVAPGNSKSFHCLAGNSVVDVHFTGDSQCLPLYRYDENGDRIDNITDWGLTQFQTHYQDSKITKENIFHYTYAVLHHPAYRTKYELNLKREFPRLPFYQDFHQWTNWGKTLMELHLNYETIQPYGLQQIEIANKENPKAKLKADKINGVITLDENTQLIGVNAIAWEYKLGNRSALEWILDQYKEKKPKDPTIAKLFNTYKFADYKEQVIDLLQRVCTVSVKTMEIIQQMP